VGGLKTPSLLDWGHPSTRITLTLALLGTGAAVFLFSTLERLANARALAEAAQRAAAENQLKLLQSQLEPHMLFNTLANLRVLIGLDPPRAQAMLDRLINFLRATLNASRRDAQPLADEFQQLDDYLALMAVRMGERLAVAFTLPPDLAALPVPPLLLQPLVENAIKHGLEPKVEGGRIEVAARREGPLLRLTVRDTGIGLGAAVNGGTAFGLEQVRTRLSTLFGAQATLTLQAAADADGGTLVTIQLPLNAAA
jgi:LytS/YehU family sensor histidine kinase